LSLILLYRDRARWPASRITSRCMHGTCLARGFQGDLVHPWYIGRSEALSERPVRTGLDQLREPFQEAIDLVLGVVVDDARADGTVVETEVLHRLHGVVIPVPDGYITLG